VAGNSGFFPILVVNLSILYRELLLSIERFLALGPNAKNRRTQSVTLLEKLITLDGCQLERLIRMVAENSSKNKRWEAFKQSDLKALFESEYKVGKADFLIDGGIESLTSDFVKKNGDLSDLSSYRKLIRKEIDGVRASQGLAARTTLSEKISSAIVFIPAFVVVAIIISFPVHVVVMSQVEASFDDQKYVECIDEIGRIFAFATMERQREYQNECLDEAQYYKAVPFTFFFSFALTTLFFATNKGSTRQSRKKRVRTS